MNNAKQHLITVKIAGSEVFKLPVAENEESFYRYVIERINDNCNHFRFGPHADSSSVALAKVTLYYATMLYRQTEQVNRQSALLDDFEARIDSLLAGTD